jgi:dolichol-phosphate mannosyltransferase
LSLATETGGFKIGLEILARSEESLRVQEVPITFQERIHGSSKLGLGVMVSYLRQLKRLSGGAASLASAWRFGLVGLLGMLADYLVFQALHSAGCSLALSHTTSFVVAAALNYTLNARWSFRGPMGSFPAKGHLLSNFASFFAVGCLALAVRGGVLALFARTAGWTPAASIIPAVAAAAIVNYLGSAFFVFSQPFQKGRAASRWGLAAVGIVAYSVVLRLAYLGQIDLLPEEAYYWNYSQHLALSYLDHPPMVAWCIRLGTAVFGQNEFGVRACAILCWLVALGFTYSLAKNLYGKPVAVRAALLFACLPFFFGVGFFMMPDAPLVACWAGAAYFLERALLGGRRAAWLGAGACIGLGMLSKYTAALIGLSAAVYLLADPRSRRWLLSPAPWAGVLLAALCFSPVIFWNAANDWISFYFQGPRRWSHAEFHTPVLILFMIILVTPLGIAAFVQGVGALRRARRSEPAVPDSDSARKLRFVLIFTLIPLGVFLAASLRCETKLNWTGPLWVVALPAMALSLGAISRRKPGLDASAVLDACWKPTILCLLLLYGFTLHVTALGMPGVSPAVFPGMVRGLATNWEDVAGEVRTLEQQLEAETGQTPLVVGLDKYELASLLAFYRRNDQGAWRTAGKSLFGKRSLMYDYWYPREVQKGRPLLLVGTEVKDVRSPSIVATFERMGPIRELLVRREGVVVGKYYTRFAYGYTAQPVVDNSYQ